MQENTEDMKREPGPAPCGLAPPVRARFVLGVASITSLDHPRVLFTSLPLSFRLRSAPVARE
jgi:hypothetical protein